MVAQATSPQRTLVNPNKEEIEMGIVKHGDGNVLPENEQQKTAAQQGGSLSEEERDALQRENEEADSGDH